MLKIGDKIPNINVTTHKGETINLEDLKGKKIISQIKIDVPSFTKKNLPKSLRQIPVSTPGSRHI